jgi:hypothetical protein
MLFLTVHDKRKRFTISPSARSETSDRYANRSSSDRR